jgi:hypothetical protein
MRARSRLCAFVRLRFRATLHEDDVCFDARGCAFLRACVKISLWRERVCGGAGVQYAIIPRLETMRQGL